MSDDDFSASLAIPDGDDNGHAGEDLDIDLALVDTIRARFKVLVDAVKTMRTEMRDERRKLHARVLRLEAIVAAGALLGAALFYVAKTYLTLKEAKIVP